MNYRCIFSPTFVFTLSNTRAKDKQCILTHFPFHLVKYPCQRQTMHSHPTFLFTLSNTRAKDKPCILTPLSFSPCQIPVPKTNHAFSPHFPFHLVKYPCQRQTMHSHPTFLFTLVKYPCQRQTMHSLSLSPLAKPMTKTKKQMHPPSSSPWPHPLLTRAPPQKNIFKKKKKKMLPSWWVGHMFFNRVMKNYSYNIVTNFSASANNPST
jgi:hypothetical protein